MTENCSGGKATCTEKATCEVCGGKYGEPLGHKLPDKWTKGEGDKHIKRCLNEGCSYYEEEACSGGEAICIGKAICDVCGGELVTRKDDKPETVKNRLAVYHRETEPLKDFYRERGVLYPVEDMGPVEATSKAILAILRQDG